MKFTHCGIRLTANINLPPSPPPPRRPPMTSVYCHLQKERKMFVEKAKKNVSEGMFFRSKLWQDVNILPDTFLKWQAHFNLWFDAMMKATWQCSLTLASISKVLYWTMYHTPHENIWPLKLQTQQENGLYILYCKHFFELGNKTFIKWKSSFMRS